MIVVSSGLVFVSNFGPTGTTATSKVRVAVLDSGIDIDFGLQSRVVAQASFISLDNGYDYQDSSTSDSHPQNVPHGTIIAKQLATYSNVELVIAKVLSTEGTATTLALLDAIEWAIEENCSVINLSLGGSPTYGDPLDAAIAWAFSQGVVVVASAGNSGESGVMGTTIESPSLYDSCIAVGALMEDDTPADFTSIGPARDRYVKPDISAAGYTTASDGSRYYGTSFSAPRVAGAAAVLIGHCIDNNITYSPGAIVTALLMGADPVGDYPEYVVGAGKLNLQQSLAIIDETSEENGLPSISYAFPGDLPLDFEKIFASDVYSFNIKLYTAGEDNFTTSIVSDTPTIFDIPEEFTVNQIGQIPVTVNVPESGVTAVNATITFTSAQFGDCSLRVSFEVGTATSRVAFDISHTPWDIDSIYGQFKEFYKLLVDNDISVTEIENTSLITNTTLHQYDAVVILDPCAYTANETDPYDVTGYYIPFSEAETQAYEDYYDSGGGIFVVGLSDSTLNVTALNEFLNWTGFSFTNIEVPNDTSPASIDTLNAHIITSGISAFDYLGATLDVPGDGQWLARYQGMPGMPVMGCKEGTNGGKLVVSGSNFMLDNYGQLGLYNGDDDNALLALRIVLWCAGELY